jgi:hypothetical protein
MLHLGLDLCVNAHKTTILAIKKRTAILIVLVTLALGLIGTILLVVDPPPMVLYPIELPGTVKVFYGSPLAWHGYYFNTTAQLNYGYPTTYWFSSGALLLDVTFWFGISFIACVALPILLNFLDWLAYALN